MNVLVVYSHPNRNSLNGAFLGRTLEGLGENVDVESVEELDLYSEGFDPLLRFDENKRRRDMYKDPVFEKYRNQLTAADTLVFIYPIWWGRPPAMLLGYFDQVFSSGFAYKDKAGQNLPDGLLKNKKVICISTMKGPSFYPSLWLRNAHKILMKRAVFSFVGIKKVRFFEFGGMEKPDGKQSKNLKRIKRVMSKL